MRLLGYWPPVAHLAVIAACLVAAWWRLDSAPVLPPGGVVAAHMVTPTPEVAEEVAEADARDARGDVEAVATRALFRPGRQDVADPASVTPAAVGEPAAPPPVVEIRMVGFVDRGGRRLAIIETVEDGQSHSVQEGDEVAGVMIKRISPDAVVIETAAQEVTIELYPD